MKHFIMPISGAFHRSLWRGFIGDSLSLAVFLAGFGLVNLLFERALRQRREAIPVSVLCVDIAVIVVSMVICALCFPPQPLVGSFVALLCYCVALAQIRAATREAAATA